MNNISKSYENSEGTKETLIASSTDNYTLNLKGKYKLANHNEKKENKFVKKFKGSILGADIGVKSAGFTNIAILATVIAMAAIAILYFLWSL